MKIKSLKIKGFRGFNSEEFFDLSSDVILIYGINGSGKSSFTEAIEWLFYDDISRRRLSPCKGEYLSGIYLKNLNSPNGGNPFVEAVIYEDSNEFTVRRELISEKKSRLFLNGTELEDLKTIGLNLQGHFRPMLAQVEISALVNTEQQDRWEELSRILGQEELTLLRNRIIDLRTEKKDYEYKKSEQTFNGIAREMESFNIDHSLIQNFENFEEEDFKLKIQELVKEQGCDESKPLQENIKSIIALISGTEFGKRISVLKIDDTALTEETKNFKEHCGNLKDLVIKSAGAKLSQNLNDFYKSGSEIAKLPECPFCLISTLTESRLLEIKKALEEDKEASQARIELQKLIDTPEGEGTKFQKALYQHLPNLNELRLISQNLGEMNLTELGGSVKILTEKIELEVKTFSEKLKLFYSGYNKALEDIYFHAKPISLSDVETVLNKHISTAEPLVINLNQEWNELRNQILSKFNIDNIKQEKELRKWISIEKAVSFLSERKIFIKKYLLIENTTKSIQSKVEEFEKREVEALLATHSEQIKAYYGRLNLGETIQFKKIEVREGQRRQAKLIAEDENGKEINPVTIFSEAHINSLSLSIYFPQRVDQNPDWELLILDDPVQSMDEGHALSLLDILNDKLRENKQVITLTHSKHFADDFAARFGNSNLTYFQFFNSGLEGPDIQINNGQSKDYLTFVKQFADGSQIEREAAGNALRKSIEAIMGEILYSKGETLAQIRKWTHKGGLPVLFAKLEESKIDLDDISKLKALLNVPHDSSHSWSVRDVAPSGLKFGIKTIEDISIKYLTKKVVTI